MPLEAVLFDTEFTVENHKGRIDAIEFVVDIVQIGAVILEISSQGIAVKSKFSCLVQPIRGFKLSPYFVNLTGITQEKLDSNGISFVEAIASFAQWCGVNVPIYSFGGKDQSVLEENCLRSGIPFPLKGVQFWDARAFFYLMGVDTSSYESGTIPKAFNLPMHGQRHDALDDARSVARALQAARRQLVEA
tara:strand:- start:3268 stop:3837 length:570 start_codon:yes stop_codon:yes gene_type:complete